MQVSRKALNQKFVGYARNCQIDWQQRYAISYKCISV